MPGEGWYELLGDSNSLKYQAVGWKHWKVHFPRCKVCNQPGYLFLYGTEKDARYWSTEPEKQVCINCEGEEGSL